MVVLTNSTYSLYVYYSVYILVKSHDPIYDLGMRRLWGKGEGGKGLASKGPRLFAAGN